jgi:hypothetical protein
LAAAGGADVSVALALALGLLVGFLAGWPVAAWSLCRIIGRAVGLVLKEYKDSPP